MPPRLTARYLDLRRLPVVALADFRALAFDGPGRFAAVCTFGDLAVPETWAAATALATSSRPQPSSGVHVFCFDSFFAVFAIRSRTLLALNAGFALSISAAAPATAGVAD